MILMNRHLQGDCVWSFMLVPEKEKMKILEIVQHEYGYEILKESHSSEILNRRKGKVAWYGVVIPNDK